MGGWIDCSYEKKFNFSSFPVGRRGEILHSRLFLIDSFVKSTCTSAALNRCAENFK